MYPVICTSGSTFILTSHFLGSSDAALCHLAVCQKTHLLASAAHPHWTFWKQRKVRNLTYSDPRHPWKERKSWTSSFTCSVTLAGTHLARSPSVAVDSTPMNLSQPDFAHSDSHVQKHFARRNNGLLSSLNLVFRPSRPDTSSLLDDLVCLTRAKLWNLWDGWILVLDLKTFCQHCCVCISITGWNSELRDFWVVSLTTQRVSMGLGCDCYSSWL